MFKQCSNFVKQNGKSNILIYSKLLKCHTSPKFHLPDCLPAVRPNSARCRPPDFPSLASRHFFVWGWEKRLVNLVKILWTLPKCWQSQSNHLVSNCVIVVICLAKPSYGASYPVCYRSSSVLAATLQASAWQMGYSSFILH